MEISVSILKEKDNIDETVKKLNKTDCDYIHLDIMDNTFTDNYSFEISELLDLTIIIVSKVGMEEEEELASKLIVLFKSCK